MTFSYARSYTVPQRGESNGEARVQNFITLSKDRMNGLISSDTSDEHMDRGHSVARIRRPRVERGRSRNGCSTCIRKKVKCDEAHPYCGRCVRLNLTCEWPLPKSSLASRRRGLGPIKSRCSNWSPSSIVPRDGDGVITHQSAESAKSATPKGMPSTVVDDLFLPQCNVFPSGSSNGNGYLMMDETSLILSPPGDISQTVFPAADSAAEKHVLCIPKTLDEEHLDNLLSEKTFELSGLFAVDNLLTIPDLSFAYAPGGSPALGDDDKQAVLFHCKIFASLKSTRNWDCSAHNLFFKKAYNRDMALHFLLAVSHSELAIHYGQGPQPPKESEEHFQRGSQLFLQSGNPFASPDHVNMMISFLYMYMFWMRRDRFDPNKLRDLSRTVLAYIRTYGLDTLCASDDVPSFGNSICGSEMTVSEQVLLARLITYLYDRDGFCCFFGCGGYFADCMNGAPQKRQKIWLRSRAAFFLPLSDVGYTHGAESEVEDAATLDAYFELIVLHQEINSYSQAVATHAIAMEPRLQRRLEAIYREHTVLFRQVADQTYHAECTLMTFVTVTFFYAMQIYLNRARVSSFGARPISSELQDALNALVFAAYYARKIGSVQLLERFQWSLFIAGLEITDPVHQEWVGKNISDPPIKKVFDCIQDIKNQSPGGITMKKIQSLVGEGFSVS